MEATYCLCHKEPAQGTQSSLLEHLLPFAVSLCHKGGFHAGKGVSNLMIKPTIDSFCACPPITVSLCQSQTSPVSTLSLGERSCLATLWPDLRSQLRPRKSRQRGATRCVESATRTGTSRRGDVLINVGCGSWSDVWSGVG